MILISIFPDKDSTRISTEHLDEKSNDESILNKYFGSSPLYGVIALFGNLKGNWAIKTKLGD